MKRNNPITPKQVSEVKGKTPSYHADMFGMPRQYLFYVSRGRPMSKPERSLYKVECGFVEPTLEYYREVMGPSYIGTDKKKQIRRAKRFLDRIYPVPNVFSL